MREWKGEVVFLRRIVPGPASQSYGIQVARLAGVPTPVIERAKQILHNLEQGEFNDAGQPRLAQGNGTQSGQLALFARTRAGPARRAGAASTSISSPRWTR